MPVNIFIATVMDQETGEEITLEDSPNCPYVIMTKECNARTLLPKYAAAVNMAVTGNVGGSEHSAVAFVRKKGYKSKTLYEIRVTANIPWLIP